ncbi:MAG: cupredoxin domain-containing protein [Candidatus Micrarchaeia archaeon]
MDYKKLFWGFTAVVFIGFFAFLAMGIAAKPANAAPAGETGAGAYYAPFGQAAQAAGATPAGGQLAAVNNGAQEVQLTVQGGNYMPNPIRVKVGVPVRITVDTNSVVGCASGIVMPEFGVRKNVRAGDNVIEFTPEKSGTFQFSCSMGMYRGTIVVEETDGTVAAYAGAAAPAATGGCGGSGGCGCGGGAGGCGGAAAGGCGVVAAPQQTATGGCGCGGRV